MFTFTSPSIKVKILGHEFYIHDEIIRECLVTGQISDQFVDVHDYEITKKMSEEESRKLAEHIVHCLYIRKFTSIKDKAKEYDLYLHEFYDKYCTEKVKEQLYRIEIVNSYVKDYKMFISCQKFHNSSYGVFEQKMYDIFTAMYGISAEYSIKDNPTAKMIFLELIRGTHDILDVLTEHEIITQEERHVLLDPLDLPRTRREWIEWRLNEL